MLHKIADLIVDIPATDDMIVRCSEYRYDSDNNADIKILEEDYKLDYWEMLSKDSAIYLESGFQFYRKLISFGGLMLHASAIEKNGKAYLFSGPSGVGKSTHTKLWSQNFGDEVQVFNDDKPALRQQNSVWYAYGTPWCGKDGINLNKKVSLGGICFLKKGSVNSIRRLNNIEAVGMIISQTSRRFKSVDRLDLMLSLVDKLVRDIPIYELTNNATPESAILSYETMRKGAEEAGL